ncbi:hypothetical protein CDAR_186931 [Caerostris darwini]|uniref:Uncharacterized protein n=1 Tax=Caerostris darwini TaxID=1538125 RepID=A0AAV4PQD3_9ARAC|nr:hypothetical protein CDAR_186931 [Caerostris darwini]
MQSSNVCCGTERHHKKNFEETGLLGTRAEKERKAVSKVAATVFDDTGTSGGPNTRAVACQTDMPCVTVSKILLKVLRFYAYKIGRMQELKRIDCEKPERSR